MQPGRPAPLNRIVEALDQAIEIAQKRADAYHPDREFRELVSHARDVHEMLLEKMRRNPLLIDRDLRAYAQGADERIRTLEQLATASSNDIT